MKIVQEFRADYEVFEDRSVNVEVYDFTGLHSDDFPILIKEQKFSSMSLASRFVGNGLSAIVKKKQLKDAGIDINEKVCFDQCDPRRHS